MYREAFRLRAKAFMLTFNCVAFAISPELWAAYHAWVQERSAKYKATYWSATLECSLHAQADRRVHLHCYLSWHGPGANGIDHATTDEWTFQGVRPRVDANTENRGPWQWLKATQHGHFYVSVHKLGTVQSATNYPPWAGLWIPDAQWVVSLWRHHKLDHDGFIELSLKLRDGHDKRKAVVDAVKAGETAAAIKTERDAARALIMQKALPSGG